MKLFFRTITVALLCMGMLTGLLSCTKLDAKTISTSKKAKDLSPVGEITEEGVIATYALALSLLSETKEEGKNQLLSPLSVMLALGMTANGAVGETRAQMEQAMGLSVEDLNRFLLGFLQTADKDVMNIAQSIWFRDTGLMVEDSFLQINEAYYGADAFAAKFDQSTKDDMNTWVKDQTKGMIDNLIDRISPSDVMYLISAMAFVADWENPYRASQIKEEMFALASGTLEKVKMMNSSESFYLSNGEALGVLKYYEGERYAFAGILPPEGVSPTDYLASLSPAEFAALLQNPKRGPVVTKIPVFSFAGDYQLNDALASLGMELAFSDGADFSGIDQNTSLSISEVKHKTFIDVNPEGTRAAAVTSVGVKFTSLGPSEHIYVYLNRPFIVVLLDTQTGLPLFVGTVNSIQ